MTYPKIKPCPQCGSIYAELYGYGDTWLTWHVECDECGYLGAGGNKLQAIREHNELFAEKEPALRKARRMIRWPFIRTPKDTALSVSAKALAARQHKLRRKSERERLIATTRKLCAEMGKPLPKALVR